MSGPILVRRSSIVVSQSIPTKLANKHQIAQLDLAREQAGISIAELNTKLGMKFWELSVSKNREVTNLLKKRGKAWCGY